MHYPGVNGFLGTRASLMMDLVFLAMLAVLPVLGWSIYQVKYRRRFGLHKTVQLTLGAVLLIAVAAFEIDVRFISGWEERARPSPYYDSWVYPSLYVHLVFSVSTAPLWMFVIVQALRKIPNPPGPSVYSQRHMLWGKLAALDMLLTSVTGWVFYWLAFGAK